MVDSFLPQVLAPFVRSLFQGSTVFQRRPTTDPGSDFPLMMYGSNFSDAGAYFLDKITTFAILPSVLVIIAELRNPDIDVFAGFVFLKI